MAATERERSNGDASLPHPSSPALLESTPGRRASRTTAWQGCGWRDSARGASARSSGGVPQCVCGVPCQPIRGGHSTIRATLMWDRSIMCLREGTQHTREAPRPVGPPTACSAPRPAASPPSSGPRDSTLPVELLLECQRVRWLLELGYGFPLLGEHLQALQEEDRSVSERGCASRDTAT